jgi:hypothetical protein
VDPEDLITTPESAARQDTKNGATAPALFSWQIFSKNFATFSTLSPSHHIKYTKRHMFGAVNIGKKLLITQF